MTAALPFPSEHPVRQRGQDAANEPAMLLVAPAPYVRISLAAVITGYTEKAIRRKIADGVWREGEVWDRGGPDGEERINMAGYIAWVESDPQPTAGQAPAAAPADGSADQPEAVETALYRHFDTAGALLYVGISVNPLQRTGQHLVRAPWVREVRTITVEWHPSRPAALAAELTAIRSERPRHNKAGAL